MVCPSRSRKTSKPREIACHICGSVFQTTHSQGKYCSPACRREGERKSWREYAERNRDSRRKWHRQDYANRREFFLAKDKEYKNTENGRRAQAVARQNQWERFPEKMVARQIVHYAVKSGALVPKPCEVCGNEKVQAHHEDYSKPLEVVWLCKKHHDAVTWANEPGMGVFIEDGKVKE
jgi:hypothetical protein